MCNCNEAKECCGCLKGGCDCICSCGCHKADDDPCSAFPRYNCPDCIEEERKAKVRSKVYDELQRRQNEALLPSDSEIKRILG